jgi:signal transduction histidine kinase
MAVDMRLRSWHLAAGGSAALVFLVIVAGAVIYTEIAETQRDIATLQDLDRTVAEVTSEMTESLAALSVALRDAAYGGLGDPGRVRRQQLTDARRQLSRGLAETRAKLKLPTDPRLEKLRHELEEYLRSADTILSWTPEEQRAYGLEFLRQQMRPQRETLQQTLAEIKAVYGVSLEQRRREILRTQEELQETVVKTTVGLASLGLVIALFTVGRLRNLEKRTERHEASLERSQAELRRLSQQLVQAQEEDRKYLSRELHDQVGQTLTALGMEIGNLRTLRGSDAEEFEEHWSAARTLSDQVLQTVRDISMGLRPSMLDDLGLEPAIRWQARGFTRRTGAPVDVTVEGNLDALPETHRIGAYRIVQEALTNCAKHAQAKEVRIRLHNEGTNLSLTIQDDGAGFDPKQTGGRGVGLVGIEERARELGGRMQVFTQPERGTLLQVDFPVEGSAGDGASTHPAG